MVIQALPGLEASITSIAVSYVLSSKPEHEESLGELRETFFYEKEIQKFQEQYRKNLFQITEKILEREKISKEKNIFPYLWLLPKNISPSVTS